MAEIPKLSAVDFAVPRGSWRRRVQIARRALVILVALGAAVLVARGMASGVIVGQWQNFTTGVAEQADTVGLSIGRIGVEGLVHTPAADINTALGFATGDNLAIVDLDAARARLEALPWIRSVSVARQLPDRVVVRVKERTAVALWQLDGVLMLLGSDARPIEESNLGGFSDLPMVVGRGAERGIDVLFGLYGAEPDLAARVRAAVRVGERRWDVIMANGIRLKLPEDTAALTRWTAFADMDRSHDLLARDVTAYDLRFPNRIIARLTPDGAKALKRGSNET